VTERGESREARQTRSSAAYAQIKERIIGLQMPPGSSFSESTLAEALSIGKTPVREALVRLELEGMVEVAPRSGYRVAPVTLKDARDLLGLRALLEGEAARLAAERADDASSLNALEQLCRASYDPNDENSIRRFLHANTRFHATIAEVGANQRLAETLHRVLEQLERLFHLGLALSSRADEIVHEHRELLEAILRGDQSGAREIAIAQCRTSQQMVMQALLSSEALSNTNVMVPGAMARGSTSGR
jgi:DNA-binding GntR family transcriptional regulator